VTKAPDSPETPAAGARSVEGDATPGLPAETTIYRHWFQTSAGSTSIELRLLPEQQAAIWIHRESAGKAKTHSVRCYHEPQGEASGVLRVLEVQTVSRKKTRRRKLSVEKLQAKPVDLGPSAAMLILEYVKLPRSRAFVPEKTGLLDQKSLGSAGWNVYFELFLFVNPLVTLPRKGPVRDVIAKLDKLKFTLAGDDEDLVIGKFYWDENE
jgi:hypothetical protein